MKDIEKIADEVTTCSQLAALLEVSAWPKPGNVHRLADFPTTRYEHFLASTAAVGPIFREASLIGAKLGLKLIKPSEVGVGNFVKKATESMLKWQKGGNVHLGVIMLFVPLCSSAGKTLVELEKMDLNFLRMNIDLIMKSTTPKDASDFYSAIAMASSPEKMGSLRTRTVPSIFDPNANKRLISGGISLYDCLETSFPWDLISLELVSRMKISFEVGYPTLMKVFNETGDINVAAVHTFLILLSKYGDTFMARKIGMKETTFIEDAVRLGLEKTNWVSKKAREAIEAGGLLTRDGRKRIEELDKKLRSSKLNPGSTADLTASSLFIALLNGLRY